MDGRDERYANTEKVEVEVETVKATRRYKGQNHDRRKRWFGRMGMLTAATILVASSFITPVAAVDMSYCSNVNTADSKPMVSIYQSNGLCIDECKEKYAFAIVQGSSCWCSNYIPATEEGGGCDESCPGYPPDKCGNIKEKLFGYMALNKAPEGTKGSEDDTVSTTSSVQPPPPPSPSTVTTEKQVTTEKDGPTTTVIITATPTKPTDKPKTTSTSSSDDEDSETTTKTTPAPTPQISIITSVGSVETVTYFPSPTASSEPQTSEDKEDGKKSGISGGAIAGIVIAIVVVIALIIAGILFWRRRQQKPYDAEGMGVIGAGGAGLIGTGRRRSRSASTLGMLGEKPVSPAGTPPGGTADGAVLGAAAAATEVETYDQRLDPGQLFMKYDRRTGSSRMSVRSLRDDTDYSRRVLRCANPDDTVDE